MWVGHMCGAAARMFITKAMMWPPSPITDRGKAITVHYSPVTSNSLWQRQGPHNDPPVDNIDLTVRLL